MDEDRLIKHKTQILHCVAIDIVDPDDLPCEVWTRNMLRDLAGVMSIRVI